jgi:hypothetical protein
MALYYDLPVYRDVYRLILKIFEHTLGQDLKRDSIVLVRAVRSF